MPWQDVTKNPTDDEVDKFIYEQDQYANAGPLTKAARWAATPLAKVGTAISDKIAEPLMNYGEGQALPNPLHGIGIGPQNIVDRLKPNEKPGWGRSAATYGGAFGETLGEGVDALTSPASLALFGAAPIGRGLQAASGVKGLAGNVVGNTVGRVGTGLTYAPKAVGYGMMGHGALGVKDAVMNPSGQGIIDDLKGPVFETTLGYLGARAPRANYAPKAPKLGTGSVVSEGLLGRPNFGNAPPPLANATGRSPMMGENLGIGRPNASEWIHDSPSVSLGPEAPLTSEGLTGPGDWSRYNPMAGQAARASVPGHGMQTGPSAMPAAVEPPYMQRIKTTFDEALGRPGRGAVPTMGETVQGQAAERTRQLQAEVDAENASLGLKASKPRAPKKAPLPTPSPLTIEEEGLRYPMSEGRAKYSQKALDEIDQSTLANPDTVGNHKGLLSDIRKRLGLEEPVSEVADAPARESWKGARFKGKDRPAPTTRRPGFKSARGEVSFGGPAPEGSPWAKAEDAIAGATARVKSGLSSARMKALDNIAAAEQRGVLGNVRKGAAALTGPDITGMGGGAKSFLQSGWAYLENMGQPGQQLARLLKRERIDVGIEKSAIEKAGGKLADAEGTPVNRTGKLILDRNKERIDELLGRITDPEHKKQAESLIKEFSGGNVTDAAFNAGVDKIKAFQGLTKLSQFGIGNVAGGVPVAMRNRLGTTLSAARKVLPGSKEFEAAYKLAQESGHLDEASGVIMSDAGHGGVSKLVDKLYRISGSEKRMRTMATLAGRDTAQELFAKLKANPTNKWTYKQLDDLLLEDDMAAVLKQPKLTDLQIKRAGGRMNELTQGLAEGIDLPPQWKKYDLATQFKKFSFMQTRNMKEAFKANPGRTLAAGLIGAPILGELTGDTKAGIKGAVKHGVKYATGDTDQMSPTLSEDIMKEIGDRGSGLDRYGANMNQAWALGLLGDVAKGIERGPSGLAEVVAGPTIGDIAEAGYGAHQLATKGQGYHLGRQAARAVPFIGTGLAASIKGSYQGKQKRKTKGKKVKN